MDAHPTYGGVPARRNTLVALGLPDEARAVYTRGLQACVSAGDGHARGELEGALAALPAPAASPR